MTLLRDHVQQLSFNTATLLHKLAHIEGDIANSTLTTDFRRLIGLLSSCDNELVKLRRRWHFQKCFIVAWITQIGGDLSAFATACQRTHVQSFAIPQARSIQDAFNAFLPMHANILSAVTWQSKLSESLKYDLDVTSGRISSQYTTVRSPRARLQTPSCTI
jgi:hypothetical protein